MYARSIEKLPFLSAISAVTLKVINMISLLMVLISLLFAVSGAQTLDFNTTKTAIPELTGGVMDHANVLSNDEKQQLHDKIMQLEYDSGSQIAVLIIPELQQEDIAYYAVKVMEKWQLGRAGIDDGALLVIALNDRAMRIEVGYGLEGAVPDLAAKMILDQYLTPEFKNGNFYQGITQAVDALIAKIKAEPLPELQTNALSISKSPTDFGILDPLFAYLVAASFLLWGFGILRGLQNYPFITIAGMTIFLGLIYYFGGFNTAIPNGLTLGEPFLREHLPYWFQMLLVQYLPAIISVILIFSIFIVAILTAVFVVFIAPFLLFTRNGKKLKHTAQNNSFKTTTKKQQSSWEAHRQQRRALMHANKEAPKVPIEIQQEIQQQYTAQAVNNIDQLIKGERKNTSISTSPDFSKDVEKPMLSNYGEPKIVDTASGGIIETLKGYEKALKSSTNSPNKFKAALLMALVMGVLSGLFAYAFFGTAIMGILVGCVVFIYQTLYQGTNLKKSRWISALFQALPSSAIIGVFATFIAGLQIGILAGIGATIIQTIGLATGIMKAPIKINVSSSSSRGSGRSSSGERSSGSSRSSSSGGGGRSGGGGASGGW